MGEDGGRVVVQSEAGAQLSYYADWNARAIYALGFLSLISAFNYLDRSILGLALPLIKTEMHVSDTALGLVSGLAFAGFYSLLGLPIAWLADRWNRRNIIALGFAFWSVMTALTGLVANIWQLAATRFLMGAGEACGLAPCFAGPADLWRSRSWAQRIRSPSSRSFPSSDGSANCMGGARCSWPRASRVSCSRLSLCSR
jgi:MFS family permease